MTTRYLELDDLLGLADQLEVGPVVDVGLLDAAAHRPRTWVGGRDAYPAVEEKAAVLLESITRSHPLVDGNKRLGWLATVTFCWINGWVVDGPDDEVYDLVVHVATGSMPYAVSARRLAGWLSPRDG